MQNSESPQKKIKLLKTFENALKNKDLSKWEVDCVILPNSIKTSLVKIEKRKLRVLEFTAEDENQVKCQISVWNHTADNIYSQVHDGCKVTIVNGTIKSTEPLLINVTKPEMIKIEGNFIPTQQEKNSEEILGVVTCLGPLIEFGSSIVHKNREITISTPKKEFLLLTWKSFSEHPFRQGKVYLFQNLYYSEISKIYETNTNTKYCESPISEESKEIEEWYKNFILNDHIKKFGSKDILDYLKMYQNEQVRHAEAGMPFGATHLSISGYQDTFSDLFRYVSDSKKENYIYLPFFIEDSYGTPDRNAAFKNGTSMDFTFVSKENWKLWYQKSLFLFRAFEQLEEKNIKSWKGFFQELFEYIERNDNEKIMDPNQCIQKISFIWRGKYEYY